jgi:acetyltransferase-like isoleucine patch superfamily enzyme
MNKEKVLRGLKNRFLQYIARYIPGATSTRVWLHRLRGVRIGEDTFIGTDVLIETAHPDRVAIGNHVIIGIRSVLVAHFDAQLNHHDGHDSSGVSIVIEDEVFVGPGVIILPNVRIGRGAVIAAGSVVTHSVPAKTMVQGNPAKPVALCETPLKRNTSIWQFYRNLKKIEKNR